MKDLLNWAKHSSYWLVLHLQADVLGRVKTYPIKLGFKIKCTPTSKIFTKLNYHFLDTPTARYLVIHLSEEQLLYIRDTLHGDHKRVVVYNLCEMTQLSLYKLNGDLSLTYYKEYICEATGHVLNSDLLKFKALTSK